MERTFFLQKNPLNFVFFLFRWLGFCFRWSYKIWLGTFLCSVWHSLHSSALCFLQVRITQKKYCADKRKIVLLNNFFVVKNFGTIKKRVLDKNETTNQKYMNLGTIYQMRQGKSLSLFPFMDKGKVFKIWLF